MKINIIINNKSFAYFDNNLNLRDRLLLAYTVIRNFEVNFNFKKIKFSPPQDKGGKRE